MTLKRVNPLSFLTLLSYFNQFCMFFLGQEQKPYPHTNACRTGPVPMATLSWLSSAGLECVYRWQQQQWKPSVRLPMRLCLKVGQSLPSGTASSQIPSAQSRIFSWEWTPTTVIRQRGQGKPFISHPWSSSLRKPQTRKENNGLRLDFRGLFWMFTAIMCVSETPFLTSNKTTCSKTIQELLLQISSFWCNN